MEALRQSGAPELLNEAFDFHNESSWCDTPLQAAQAILLLKRSCAIASVQTVPVLRSDGRLSCALRGTHSGQAAVPVTGWVALDGTQLVSTIRAPSPVTEADAIAAHPADAKTLDEFVATDVASVMLHRDCRNQTQLDEALSNLCGAEHSRISLAASCTTVLLAAAATQQPLHWRIAALARDQLPTPSMTTVPMLWMAVAAGEEIFLAPAVGSAASGGVATLGDAVRLLAQTATSLRRIIGASGMHDAGNAIYPVATDSDGIVRALPLGDLASHLTQAARESGLRKFVVGTRGGVPLSGGFTLDPSESKGETGASSLLPAQQQQSPPAAPTAGAATEAASYSGVIADRHLYRSHAASLSEQASALRQLRGVQWVALRPSRFGCVSDMIAFTSQARGLGLRVVVVADADCTDVVAGSDAPAFVAHLAVGLGAEALLLPPPSAGHATAVYNEMLRIEDQLLERLRRWPRFATAAAPHDSFV